MILYADVSLNARFEIMYAGIYPVRLPRLMAEMFINPYNPKAFSMSSFS